MLCMYEFATSRRNCSPFVPRGINAQLPDGAVFGPKKPILVIGETGFEPATARPPAGCATRLRPSPWLTKAGDRNRTGPRSLEGFCAATTLRPHTPSAMLPAPSAPHSSPRPPPSSFPPFLSSTDPSPSAIATLLSSTGTSPASSASPGGGQGPNQLSRPPSRVTVDPLKARPSREQSIATSQACSIGFPNRWIGTVREAPARTDSGYLAVTSVAKWPAATAVTVTPSPAHLAASSAVKASTVARAAPE